MADALKVRCHGCGQKLDLSELEPFTTLECPECTTKLIRPQPFGNLMLEETVGRGEAATVYRAIDVTLDRQVAVKVLKPEHAQNEDIAEKYLNTASTASTASHPHLLPIYSCGRLEEEPYIVMQYMARGGLPTAGLKGHDALLTGYRWCRDATLGLEAAHNHGVLHHNICPGNILLDQEGNIKVADFGLADVIRSATPFDIDNLPSDATHARYFYLSPEKITTGSDDARGDIYSLGATFYHVIAGRPPFQGDTIKETINGRFTQRPKPLRELCVGVTPEVNDIILKMLAVIPSDRPMLHAEIAAVFEQAISGTSSTPTAAPVSDTPNEPKAKKRPVDERRPQKRVMKAASARAAQPLPVAKPTTSGWFSVFVPASIIITIAVLVAAHMTNQPWYVEHILPHLPVRPNQQESTVPTPPAPHPPQADSAQPLPPQPTVENRDSTSLLAAISEMGDSLFSDSSASPPHRPSPSDNVPHPHSQPNTKQPPVLSEAVVRARPRPNDLNFQTVESELRAYVESLPEAEQSTEKMRINLIYSCRSSLITWMKYMPFTEPTRIRLTRGRTIRGTIPLANKMEIVIKSESGRRTNHLWSELAIDQYFAFFEHYLKTRLDRPPPNTKAENHRASVAHDYYQLAVLADWYNYPQHAQRFANAVAELDPTLMNKVDFFVPTRSK